MSMDASKMATDSIPVECRTRVSADLKSDICRIRRAVSTAAKFFCNSVIKVNSSQNGLSVLLRSPSFTSSSPEGRCPSTPPPQPKTVFVEPRAVTRVLLIRAISKAGILNDKRQTSFAVCVVLYQGQGGGGRGASRPCPRSSALSLFLSLDHIGPDGRYDFDGALTIEPDAVLEHFVERQEDGVALLARGDGQVRSGFRRRTAFAELLHAIDRRPGNNDRCALLHVFTRRSRDGVARLVLLLRGECFRRDGQDRSHDEGTPVFDPRDDLRFGEDLSHFVVVSRFGMLRLRARTPSQENPRRALVVLLTNSEKVTRVLLIRFAGVDLRDIRAGVHRLDRQRGHE